MMLQDILCHMKEKLMATGYFNAFYEYSELVERNEIVFPAQYVGGGEYKSVMDFDVNGSGYTRKRDKVYMRQSTKFSSVTSCDTDTIVEMTFPLRMVVGVPKVKLSDTAYSDDALFSEVANVIGGTYSASRAIDVSTEILAYDTNSLSIWPTEVKGKPYQMNFRLSYIAVDFNLIITANQSCLAKICGYGY